MTTQTTFEQQRINRLEVDLKMRDARIRQLEARVTELEAAQS